VTVLVRDRQPHRLFEESEIREGTLDLCGARGLTQSEHADHPMRLLRWRQK